MSVRLIRCDQRGEPLESLGALPRVLNDNCQATAGLFASIGFVPPWVGYVTVDNDRPVGGCAFVGAPKDGSVEIAYFTLEEFAGRGYSTQAVSRMIEIAWENTRRIISARKATKHEKDRYHAGDREIW